MINRRDFFKDNLFLMVLITITGTAILITGIIYKQSVLNITPLFVSLFIAYLSSKANKYALLLGSMNCVLYTIVYFILGLYSSALTTMLIDGPCQLISFIRWNKKSYKNSTVFKKTKPKFWLIYIPCAVILYFVLLKIMVSRGSRFATIDVACTVLSLTTYLLTILTYKECAFIPLISAPLSLVLAILVFLTTPAHITYVIYSVYSLICLIKRYVSVNRLYKEQQKEKTNENHTS